jgi:nucleotide-binding universal stress UspA family protein
MRAKSVQTTKQEQTGLNSVLLALGAEDADRVERLAEEAIDIAGPAGATVLITHVFAPDEYERRLDNLGFDRESADFVADDVAVRHSPIRDIAGRLDEAGVDHEIRGSVGDYGEEIVRIAEETETDMVMVGGRKRSPTGKAVFGSVAQDVMLSAPCPVTFVRSDTK